MARLIDSSDSFFNGGALLFSLIDASGRGGRVNVHAGHCDHARAMKRRRSAHGRCNCVYRQQPTCSRAGL